MTQKNSRRTIPRKKITKTELKRLCKIALDLGAPEVHPISPKKVVTAEWVRYKCQYGCGGYGRYLTCPPHSPTPVQTRRMLDEYDTAFLIHFTQSRGAGKIGPVVERAIFLEGYDKAFAFLAGPCRGCRGECALEGGCRHPDTARPSMEAAGIDVFATARSLNLPIDVVTSHDGEQNYYSLVLIQ